MRTNAFNKTTLTQKNALLLLSMIMASPANFANAQEFIAELGAKTKPQVVVRLGVTGQPEMRNDKENNPANLQKTFISLPISQSESDPISISWKWSQLNIDTDKKIPRSTNVPSHLMESEYSLTYKHFGDQSSLTGLHLGYGSASDQLFKDKSVSTISATAFYSNTEDAVGRWIWLLSYSDNRTFANGVPLPGFAYIYRPSADFFGVFGFPFLFIRAKAFENYYYSVLLGPYVYRLDFSKPIAGPVQAYIATDHTNQSYYRKSRSIDDEHFYYSETKLQAGIRSPISQMMFADVFGGLVFGRSFLEAKSFRYNDDDRVFLENRWLVGTNLTARF